MTNQVLFFGFFFNCSRFSVFYPISMFQIVMFALISKTVIFSICCRPVAEGQGSNVGGIPASIVVSLPTAPPLPPMPLARQNNSLSSRKPGVLPANLEEMKVLGWILNCMKRLNPVVVTAGADIKASWIKTGSCCVATADTAESFSNRLLSVAMVDYRTHWTRVQISTWMVHRHRCTLFPWLYSSQFRLKRRNLREENGVKKICAKCHRCGREKGKTRFLAAVSIFHP